MAKIDQRTVTVHRRLRPLRIAFLVRPTDRAALRRIFHINTCLWGGRFNLIIPIFRRTPRWWSEPPFPSPSAREIAKGYLDAFEPDFVVAMSHGLADGLSIPEGRLLTEKHILDPTQEDPIGYGVDIAELYRDLYEKEFQFQRRHPFEIVLPKVEQRGMALFGAACFGEFPPEESLQYLQTTYRDAFDAKWIKVEGSTVFTILSARMGFPLRMGSDGLVVRPRGWIPDPTLFFMDAASSIDLIDYWNLRAVGWSILPVPRQWANAVVDKCSEFVMKNYVPYRHNKEMMHSTKLLRSRSVPLSEVEAFATRLAAPGQDSLTIQPWYPRMWDEWARDKDNVLRCDLVGGGADVEVRVTDSTISFRDLSPGFVKRFGGRGTPKWANVVQVRDYSRIPESASVIPAGLPGLDRLLGSVPFGETWATREGIVIACKYVDWNHRWTLPSGLDVFQAWAKGHTFEIDLSGPGRVATQVIRALGGTWGSRFLAHEEIIRLLNQMASGLVESEAEEEGNGGQRKKVRGKIVKVGEWRTRLKQVNSGHEDVAKRHLDFLVLHKVLDVGLRL